MSKASDPPGNNNPTGSEPDSGAWIGSEADKEIAVLRNALDEHLRSLDTPKPLAGSSKQSPQAASYSDDAVDKFASNQASSSDTRSWLVPVAAFSGLVFGVYFTVILVRMTPVNTPSPARQATFQAPKDLFTSSQPNQKRLIPSAAPNSSSQSSEPDVMAKPPAEAGSERLSSAESTEVTRWQACLDNDRRDVDPPQPGETWWPVVGSSDSLADARLHCRADAFINTSGNAQISSFRDRQTAITFAEQLTQDSSHPWRFRVGEPSVR